jgi:hypothetical protein
MTAYSRDSDVEYVHMNWQVPVDVIEQEYLAVKDSIIIHRYTIRSWLATNKQSLGIRKA